MCLRKGHITRSYNPVLKCDVENCKIPHRSVLHTDSSKNHVLNLSKEWNSVKLYFRILIVKIYGLEGSLEI